MSRKSSSRKHTGLCIVLFLLILVMIAATVFILKLCLDIPGQEPENRPGTSLSTLPTIPTETEAPTETTAPQPVQVISTATIGAMGDLLMHMPIFDRFTKYNAEVQQDDGSYDFESVFRYIAEYTTDLDYAAANLETTLAGTDNGYAYSGYPHFNCPDAIVDGAKEAGFDMLLTANNHSYDTGLTGYKRTVEIIQEKGLEPLGTYTSSDETKWTIVDINGIQVGMLCYTWAYNETEDGRPSLNGNLAISEAGICNYFYSGNLPSFYTEVENYLTEMENAGAEATIAYIHWGIENQLTANEEQKAMAQKLCDLGIDVIIGGHPHVVQPVELLESTVDPAHKTVCLYSMGNAVSNQRLGNLESISTAHTEDGILFTVTFEKYSDGNVYLVGTDALPTWVNMRTNDRGRTEYNILPLDDERKDDWGSLFDIGEATLNAARNSYERTMAIVGEGLAECQTWLEQAKADRETYYLELSLVG